MSFIHSFIRNLYSSTFLSAPRSKPHLQVVVWVRETVMNGGPRTSVYALSQFHDIVVIVDFMQRQVMWAEQILPEKKKHVSVA